jgi:hypothetical protein
MKRSLLLAVSVLALTAVSKPLFAAEVETPAPSERAAPAAERAPAQERRAGPARQRQATRTTGGQQQASQTSSYTGAQAGGFGGGNVGGGGFADPICLNAGSNSSSNSGGGGGGLNNGCPPAPFNQSLTKSGGRGGGVIQWTTAVTPWIVVGVLGDLSFGQTSATATQNNFYPSDPLIMNQVTAEQIQSTVTQKTSGSIRFKAGVVVPLGNTSILPYTTVGWTRSQIQGTFTYSASNYNTIGCTAFNPMCSTIAGSAVSFTQNRNGVVFGFGAEMPIPAFGPGVVLVFDYTRAQFGSFDVNLPASIASIGGSACVPSSQTVCAVNDIGHFSNVSTNTFTVGARFKLF